MEAGLELRDVGGELLEVGQERSAPCDPLQDAGGPPVRCRDPSATPVVSALVVPVATMLSRPLAQEARGVGACGRTRRRWREPVTSSWPGRTGARRPGGEGRSGPCPSSPYPPVEVIAGGQGRSEAGAGRACGDGPLVVPAPHPRSALQRYRAPRQLRARVVRREPLRKPPAKRVEVFLGASQLGGAARPSIGRHRLGHDRVARTACIPQAIHETACTRRRAAARAP
jgi:hypothetical protein